MTIRTIAARLQKAGIGRTADCRTAECPGAGEAETAVYEALLLAEAFTGTSRAMLRASMDEELGPNPALLEAVERRCARYPLQYLLGSWEFMGLSFRVDERCLIPRADTEILCEYILTNAKPGAVLLDLCTGSGCIAAAVLHHRPDITGVAVELYPDTLALAMENFRRTGVEKRIRAIVGDAGKDLFEEGLLFDVIASNPPYIAKKELSSLEPELAAEPLHALTPENDPAGDGLGLLFAILRVYGRRVAEDGFLILEHGADQGKKVTDYAKKLGFAAKTLRDYGGNDRAAVLRHPHLPS